MKEPRTAGCCSVVISLPTASSTPGVISASDRKEMPRPDRNDSAGMLFMNDEGTENGGMLFGGYQSSDGKFHSWGHLSFRSEGDAASRPQRQRRNALYER